MDHSDIDDFMSSVGFSDEAIAGAKELIDSSPYQPGVWVVREENREPAVTLFERTR